MNSLESSRVSQEYFYNISNLFIFYLKDKCHHIKYHEPCVCVCVCVSEGEGLESYCNIIAQNIPYFIIKPSRHNILSQKSGGGTPWESVTICQHIVHVVHHCHGTFELRHSCLDYNPWLLEFITIT